MGRTVPEGYSYHAEYALGDRRVIAFTPEAATWKTAEKQRQMAAVLLEIFSCVDASTLEKRFGV